ncbi:hypothetical protein PVK06_019653 [Gossypium arboreum]|uniref:DUF4283 domain-containing protein n=1 Tax=Gossypium arboreum TaxID=29729 RepID=A0ABR0PKD2_GOSAR|nr:hypothetical protein PVK06_019653 [Gossypium arboreum]
MLVGSMKPLGRDVKGRVDDDLQILEDDVTIGMEDGLPSIRFSKRIHQALYKSMTYPSNMVAWIRFPGILGFMYLKSVLTNIGEMVGHVIKQDDQTGNAQRGHFVRMRHLKDMYNFESGQEGQKYEGTLPSVDCGNSNYANKNVENENFRPWMLFDHRRKRNVRKQSDDRKAKKGADSSGSRFDILQNLRENNKELISDANPINSTSFKGKGVAIYNSPLGEDHTIRKRDLNDGAVISKLSLDWLADLG